MRVFLDLMWYFKARKRRYLTGVLFLVFVAILGLIPPRIVGITVDALRLHTLTPALLSRNLVIIAISAGLMYVFRYLWRLMLFGSAIELSTTLRFRLYHHFTKMSAQFFHKHRIGDLMAHATNDISAIEMVAWDGVLTLVDSITTGTLVILTMALTISWKLTLVALLPLPVIAVTTSIYGNILHRRFERAQAAFSDINDKVQENISGMRVIKSFGQQDPEVTSFSELATDVAQKNVAVARIDALFDPTIIVIIGFSYFLSIALGSLFVVHRDLTIGNLTSFSIYLGQLIWPMLAFGWLFNIVERGRASSDRVNLLLGIQEDIRDKEGSRTSTPSGDIVYSVREFAYEGTNVPALQDLNLALKRGQTLGIVGKTGSGKTTFLKLLLREYDVLHGDIQIGDFSIYGSTLDALRSAIAYVPQDHFLFSATIEENIAFANPRTARKEVERAAKLANIHDDILAFQSGYETLVGERGVTLSGGQKQRISIARALLLDAEILILDDALSAVDARTEAQILESLRTNRHERTTLIATHRLSAVSHADWIIVLEHGRIIAEGTHEDLISQDGWYKTMYEHQQLESLVLQGGGEK